MFAFSPNFDRHPRISAALNCNHPEIDVNWGKLFSPDFDSVWEEVGSPAFYNEAEWFPVDSKETKNGH
jgi:hypothetical protein